MFWCFHNDGVVDEEPGTSCTNDVMCDGSVRHSEGGVSDVQRWQVCLTGPTQRWLASQAEMKHAVESGHDKSCTVPRSGKRKRG